jgi:hypothetical protein
VTEDASSVRIVTSMETGSGGIMTSKETGRHDNDGRVNIGDVMLLGTCWGHTAW